MRYLDPSGRCECERAGKRALHFCSYAIMELLRICKCERFQIILFFPKIFSIVFLLLISIEIRSFDWSSENNVILFSSSFINFMLIVDRLMGFCCCWQCLSRWISIVVTFFRIRSPNLWVLFDVNKFKHFNRFKLSYQVLIYYVVRIFHLWFF